MALLTTNIHFISGEQKPSSDSYYYVDCFTHLVQHSNIFDKITKLYVSGDHGPHFRSRATVFFESTIYEKSKDWRCKRGINSGLELHAHFLCSYHAFNRCDGAGACVKMAAVRSSRPGLADGWPNSPREYVQMIKDGLTEGKSETKANHHAVLWPHVDRDANLFPDFEEKPNDNHQATTNLVKRCEIKYSFNNNDGSKGHMDGIALVRDVSGEGEFYVIDLWPSCSNGRGKLCQCSNNVLRPVHHDVDETQCSDNFNKRDDLNIEEPDVTRLAAHQIVKVKKVRPKTKFDMPGNAHVL